MKKIKKLSEQMQNYTSIKKILNLMTKINLEFFRMLLIFQKINQNLSRAHLQCVIIEKETNAHLELSASEMTHDKKSKTIFYDNAIIKIYDIPIFYFPKLAHPDPSVDRRSGFLNPSYSDTKNLGSSLSVPYFLAIDEDRDLTINSRLFATEHPLFLGEYRQVFKNSNLVFDFGHTQGYKKISSTKKAGINHIFF